MLERLANTLRECAQRKSINDKLGGTIFKSTTALATAAVLLCGCTVLDSIKPSTQPQPRTEQPATQPLPLLKIDPMADVPGEKPVTAVQQGAIERIDCTSGKPDWHARIAFEAQGGQVTSFAYYSRWKPRTCSLELTRNGDGAKWRMTRDGAVRVHTPQGRYLIRTSADAYVFEFEDVQRQKFCGMPGAINGTMTVKRGSDKPECSAAGIMDTNDPFLDSLYKSRY